MLMSLCPQIDLTAVVRAMVDDINLERGPCYAQLEHAVLDQLEDLKLTGRTDWLALSLPAVNQRDAFVSAFWAARAEASLQLGLMPAVVTDVEVRRPSGLRLSGRLACRCQPAVSRASSNCVSDWTAAPPGDPPRAVYLSRPLSSPAREACLSSPPGPATRP
ncbi:hypothetical protein ACIOMM_35780 [Streptomyces sp. NPDC087908]|uniref:hypothetical protein n=1 Tax=Streptomyces sp. NPDC087908 TaxID=3365820 RepID=UPI00382C851C